LRTSTSARTAPPPQSIPTLGNRRPVGTIAGEDKGRGGKAQTSTDEWSTGELYDAEETKSLIVIAIAGG